MFNKNYLLSINLATGSSKDRSALSSGSRALASSPVNREPSAAPRRTPDSELLVTSSMTRCCAMVKGSDPCMMNPIRAFLM